jgi:hypothetical protein
MCVNGRRQPPQIYTQIYTQRTDAIRAPIVGID